MNGFITESMAKISDGFFAALYLLLLFLLTKFILIPIQYLFHQPGTIIYIIVLLALAAYELNRSLNSRTSDQRRARKGMMAGLYFWQAFLLIATVGAFPVFQYISIFFWLLVLLFTVTLWKRVFPVGVRMGMLVFLTCWMGKFYFMGFGLLPGWPTFVVFCYSALQYFAVALGIGAVIYIIYRSHDIAGRGYAAIVIFNAVLYLLRAF